MNSNNIDSRYFLILRGFVYTQFEMLNKVIKMSYQVYVLLNRD